MKTIKEKKWKNKSVEPIWVIKDVTKKEWSVMKNIESYCYLESIGNNKFGKVRVGFSVAGSPFGKIPKDCSICTDNELRIIDLYRRAKSLYPFPLKPVKTLAKTSAETSAKTSTKVSTKTSAEIPFAF